LNFAETGGIIAVSAEYIDKTQYILLEALLAEAYMR